MSPAPALPLVSALLPFAVDTDVVEFEACADELAPLVFAASVSADVAVAVVPAAAAAADDDSSLLLLVLLLLLLLLADEDDDDVEPAATAFTTRSTFTSVSGFDELLADDEPPFDVAFVELAFVVPPLDNVTTVLAAEPLLFAWLLVASYEIKFGLVNA